MSKIPTSRTHNVFFFKIIIEIIHTQFSTCIIIKAHKFCLHLHSLKFDEVVRPFYQCLFEWWAQQCHEAHLQKDRNTKTSQLHMWDPIFLTSIKPWRQVLWFSTLLGRRNRNLNDFKCTQYFKNDGISFLKNVLWIVTCFLYYLGIYELLLVILSIIHSLIMS